MKASTPDKNHCSYHFIISRNLYYFIVGINTLIIYYCYHDYTYIIVIIVCVCVLLGARGSRSRLWESVTLTRAHARDWEWSP